MLQSALMFQLSQINVFRLVGAGRCYDLLPPGRRRGGKGDLDTGVELKTANDPSVFTITEKAPTISWWKAPSASMVSRREIGGLLRDCKTSPMDRLQLYTGASLVSTQLVQCCLCIHRIPADPRRIPWQLFTKHILTVCFNSFLHFLQTPAYLMSAAWGPATPHLNIRNR